MADAGWKVIPSELIPGAANLYAEYIMRNTGLEETQAGIKIAGRNSNNLRYADDTTLMAESEEDGSPPGSPVPAILQARTLEWVAISFSIA